jgi:hypothetical protein
MMAGLLGVVCFLIFVLVPVGIIIAALWKVYSKAGEPGWASIVPVYSNIVLLKITGRPIWWIFLEFIPVVGMVIGIIQIFDLARCFGKEGGFAIGLLFLPFIFIPILGFGSAEYVGPDGAGVRRRKRRPAYEDEEEEYEEDEEDLEEDYDRPRRRRRRDDDYEDEEDEDRPRRRRRRDEDYEDDEYEERPRRRARPAEEEEELEEAIEAPASPPRPKPAAAAPPPPPPAPTPQPAAESRLVQCEGCKRTLRLPANVAGRTVKCPSCGLIFIA